MTFEAIVSFAKKYRNYLIAGALLLVLIGVSLWIWQATSNWWFNRDLEKKKANVNAALLEVNQLQSNADASKVIANRIIENVNIATQELANATNATDAQRERTNQAIANMQKAANQNRNVNAAELEKILEGIK